MLQLQTREPCHQVHLGRPRISHRHRLELDTVNRYVHSLRVDPLRYPVVPARFHLNPSHIDIERSEPLPLVEPAHVRKKCFEHKTAARIEMRGNIAEAANLIFLALQGEECVEDQEDQAKRALNRNVGEVAHDDWDLRTTCLGS